MVDNKIDLSNDISADNINVLLYNIMEGSANDLKILLENGYKNLGNIDSLHKDKNRLNVLNKKGLFEAFEYLNMDKYLLLLKYGLFEHNPERKVSVESMQYKMDLELIEELIKEKMLTPENIIFYPNEDIDYEKETSKKLIVFSNKINFLHRETKNTILEVLSHKYNAKQTPEVFEFYIDNGAFVGFRDHYSKINEDFIFNHHKMNLIKEESKVLAEAIGLNDEKVKIVTKKRL